MKTVSHLKRNIVSHSEVKKDETVLDRILVSLKTDRNEQSK